MSPSEYGELVEFLGRKFDRIDRRFEQIDRRFEQMDQRFEQMDQRFERIEQRLTAVEVGAEHDRHLLQLCAEAIRGNSDRIAANTAAIVRLEEAIARLQGTTAAILTRVERLEAA